MSELSVEEFLHDLNIPQEFKDDNILETAIAMGFPQLALEVLEEDYYVKLCEFKDDVLIDADYSKARHYDIREGLTELAVFMVENEIRFLHEASSLQLQLNDFLELGKELARVNSQ